MVDRADLTASLQVLLFGVEVPNLVLAKWNLVRAPVALVIHEAVVDCRPYAAFTSCFIHMTIRQTHAWY